MSTVITKNLQVGNSLTATNNFTVYQPASPDGTVRIANGNSGSTMDLVTVNSSGNVGIGTSSPSHNLTVTANTATTVIVSKAQAGQAAYVTACANNGTVGTNSLDLIQLSDGTGYVYQRANQPLIFGTNNTERMRVDSEGNVGIGISTPAMAVSGRALHLHAPSGQSAFFRATNGDNGTTGTDGMAVGMTGSNAYVWNYEFGAVIIGTTNGERARFFPGGDFAIGTTGSPYTETVGCLRFIKGSGELQFTNISTTGDATAAMVFKRVYTGDYIRFFVGGASPNLVGTINTNGTTTSYNTTSDYRLKENVTPMTGALDKVAQLKPCTYTWKADGSAGQGFIAHELQAVVPDCVTGEKDAVDADGNPQYQGVDTSFLVATVVAALQELKAEFDAYKLTHP